MKSVYRFHLGSLVRGIESEDKAYRKTEGRSQQDHPRVQIEGEPEPLDHAVGKIQYSPGKKDSYYAAHHAEYHRHHKELPENAPPRGSDGLANADLTGAISSMLMPLQKSSAERTDVTLLAESSRASIVDT